MLGADVEQMELTVRIGVAHGKCVAGFECYCRCLNISNFGTRCLNFHFEFLGNASQVAKIGTLGEAVVILATTETTLLEADEIVTHSCVLALLCLL